MMTDTILCAVCLGRLRSGRTRPRWAFARDGELVGGMHSLCEDRQPRDADRLISCLYMDQDTAASARAYFRRWVIPQLAAEAA